MDPSPPAEPESQPRGGTARCAAAASTDRRIEEALARAADDAAGRLGRRADLACVFVSHHYGRSIRPALEGLADLLGAGVVVGTTAEAVLAGDEEHENRPAVSVWLASLPDARLIPFALEHTQTPDGGMFAGWPAEPAEGWPRSSGVILLADPFSFPVDAFIRRIEEDHPGVPVVGGMASGGPRPGSNTLVVGSRSYDSGAVGFVLGGAARIRPVVSQGCRPIGTPLVITKAEENMILELGGRPALERLREIYATLDQADRQLVRGSLHVGRVASEYQDQFHRGDFLVRNVVGADPDSGAIAVGDLVRTGQTIQFHVRDAGSAHEDLAGLLARSREQSAAAAGALLFTCNGRGSRLFDEPHHDARCLRAAFGPLPVAGFFAQGEIGPIGRRNCLHGFTASIALVEQVP